MVSKALITGLEAWSLYQTILSLEEAIFVFYVHVCMRSQSCLILCDHVDCSPPGFSVHGVFSARTLEWGAISYSRGSS